MFLEPFRERRAFVPCHTDCHPKTGAPLSKMSHDAAMNDAPCPPPAPGADTDTATGRQALPSDGKMSNDAATQVPPHQASEGGGDIGVGRALDGSAGTGAAGGAAGGAAADMMISWLKFCPNDIALFLLLPQKTENQNRAYLAFHEGRPHHYLSADSTESFRKANNGSYPHYIVGKVRRSRIMNHLSDSDQSLERGPRKGSAERASLEGPLARSVLFCSAR